MGPKIISNLQVLKKNLNVSEAKFLGNEFGLFYKLLSILQTHASIMGSSIFSNVFNPIRKLMGCFTNFKYFQII